MTGERSGPERLAHLARGMSTALAMEPHIGVFDLFKIGIEPSSSHTVWPMKAAAAFIRGLDVQTQRAAVRVTATAYGSLAWTGKGHGTDRALMLGLAGYEPQFLDQDQAERACAVIVERKAIFLRSDRKLPFDDSQDIVFDRERTFARTPTR